jgi:hypothetical protein
MCQIGERLQVVAKSVLVRDERDRQQARTTIDERLEIGRRDRATVVPRDSQLDPSSLFELPEQYELRLVVQLVDDDVVAGFEIESTGNEVFALARRRQKANLLGTRVDQAGKLRAHLVSLRLHVGQRDGTVALGPQKRRACVGDDLRGWADVCGIEVKASL